MIELLKGYPAYVYFGIFESHFGKELGGEIVKVLDKDKLLEILPASEPPQYRLTGAGINVAISMINWNYSEQTRIFTIAVIALTALTLLLGINQLIITLH